MIIKTWELDRENGEFGFNYTEDLSCLANEQQEISAISPVTVVGTVSKVENYYMVNGRVEVEMTYDCSRCLRVFTKKEEISFSEIFTVAESEASISDEEPYTIIEDNEINIKPIVEEAVAMLIPYIPICDEGCKGLCASCGIDLNVNSCECTNERVDPRLAGLADWFTKE